MKTRVYGRFKSKLFSYLPLTSLTERYAVQHHHEHIPGYGYRKQTTDTTGRTNMILRIIIRRVLVRYTIIKIM